MRRDLQNIAMGTSVSILNADVLDGLAQLADESVHCVMTSPPYFGLRDYGTGAWEGGDEDCKHSVGSQVQDNKAPGAIITGQRPGVDASRCRRCGATRIDKQIGLEPSPDAYVQKLVEVFREVRRVLRKDGTLWLNLGDSYAGQPAGNKTPSGFSQTRPSRRTGNHDQETVALPKKKFGIIKPKDLVGIPWRVALALQADGWWLRQDIIWSKPNPMPESISDRCTKAHEYLFLLTKSERYYYDAAAITEPATYSGGGQDETGFKSPANFAGKNADGGARGHRKTRWKTPDGWDTSRGSGGHGSFHREGREKGHTGYVAKSGNKERKSASARGVPVDADGKTRGDVAGSVPWEGSTRNKRSVWTIATSPFPEAHFATFPPALVEPCVKAGASGAGCCAECGAPRRRQTEHSEEADASHKGSRFDAGKTGSREGGERTQKGSRYRRVGTGWAPSCECGARTTPCTVLDPFAGSGTVGLVANRLGRNTVLIELSPKYARMAERRIVRDAPLGMSLKV